MAESILEFFDRRKKEQEAYKRAENIRSNVRTATSRLAELLKPGPQFAPTLPGEQPESLEMIKPQVSPEERQQQIQRSLVDLLAARSEMGEDKVPEATKGLVSLAQGEPALMTKKKESDSTRNIREAKELVDLGIAKNMVEAYRMVRPPKDKKVNKELTKRKFLANAYQNILKNEMYAGDSAAIQQAMQDIEKFYDESLATEEERSKRPSTGKEKVTKTTKQLDFNTAQALLKEAGGDKNKARQLARKRGYSF